MEDEGDVNSLLIDTVDTIDTVDPTMSDDRKNETSKKTKENENEFERG